jgi:hypothetical protein
MALARKSAPARKSALKLVTALDARGAFVYPIVYL